MFLSRKRLLLGGLLAAPLLLGFSAAAQEAGGEGGKPGTNVDMPFLIAPMNDADGKLVSYAYISSRLTATAPAGALEVRDRIAFIQDAFVRDVNGAAITKSDDPASVDMAGLQGRLLADARRIMGAGKVASLAVVQVQIAPLHPKPSDVPAGATPPASQPAAPPAASGKPPA